MQVSLALLLLAATSVATSFRLQPVRWAAASSSVSRSSPRGRAAVVTRLQAESSSGSSGIEPTKENVESVAGVTGGVLGFLFFGPVVGLGLAAVSMYVSKKDNDGGEAVRGVSRSVLDAVNYFSKLNNKFDVTGKVGGKLAEVVDSNESEAVVKAKEVLSKVSEVNSQYGLLDKGKEAIAAASKMSEVVFEKAEEMNTKYDFVALAKEAAQKAADKAKELAANSNQ